MNASWSSGQLKHPRIMSSTDSSIHESSRCIDIPPPRVQFEFEGFAQRIKCVWTAVVVAYLGADNKRCAISDPFLGRGWIHECRFLKVMTLSAIQQFLLFSWWWKMSPSIDVQVPARRTTATHRDNGAFPSEAEIARRLSQDPKSWPAIALVLERQGLPRIDPLMGGRFWPAVQAWFLRRYGLTTFPPFNPDGEENLNAL